MCCSPWRFAPCADTFGSRTRGERNHLSLCPHLSRLANPLSGAAAVGRWSSSSLERRRRCRARRWRSTWRVSVRWPLRSLCWCCRMHRPCAHHCLPHNSPSEASPCSVLVRSVRLSCPPLQRPPPPESVGPIHFSKQAVFEISAPPSRSCQRTYMDTGRSTESHSGGPGAVAPQRRIRTPARGYGESTVEGEMVDTSAGCFGALAGTQRC
jgi:hypothetical protein